MATVAVPSIPPAAKEATLPPQFTITTTPPPQHRELNKDLADGINKSHNSTSSSSDSYQDRENDKVVDDHQGEESGKGGQAGRARDHADVGQSKSKDDQYIKAASASISPSPSSPSPSPGGGKRISQRQLKKAERLRKEAEAGEAGLTIHHQPPSPPSSEPTSANSKENQNHRRNQSLPASVVNGTSPNTENGHAANGQGEAAKGDKVSHHKLLAPPPISSRNGRPRSNSQPSPLSGSGKDHLSPPPSPSPPASPFSPYLEPDHPKRRGSFSHQVNEMFHLESISAQLAPSRWSSHPYVVHSTVFILTFIAACYYLNLPYLSPFTAIADMARFLYHHAIWVLALLLAASAAFAYSHRSSLRRTYRLFFCPPAADALPKVFQYESINLDDYQHKLAKWAKLIDANSNLDENEIPAAASSSSPSPSSSSPPSSPSPPLQSFDRITGANALALMQSYQKGQIDDCDFTVLRISSKQDAATHNDAVNKANADDDTLGLIFISSRIHYDLSPYLFRLFTPIACCFPWLVAPALVSTTIRRWLSFRFTLIGFHWPFRSCILFTQPIDKFQQLLQINGEHPPADLCPPGTDVNTVVHVARYAAMLQLVRQWDRAQPKEKQSDFILFPCLASSCVYDAIPASGAAALPLLPTYVADLRAFKGKEWQDYKRHLRKMNRKVREGPFEGAGGNSTVVEGPAVTTQLAQQLVTLWNQVANYREQKDTTSCLMVPSAPFVTQLAQHPQRFINYLALKLGDTTVAASLLFSLSPALLTSDIAGFNYAALEDAGRKANQQIKAYPVKLAAVLKYAIANRYEFVDFGPTTGSSKMEIGCQEIKISGGLYYRGAFTSFAVKVASVLLNKQHAVSKATGQ